MDVPDLPAGCPVEAALDVLAGKWKGMLIFHLLGGTRRFNQLLRLCPGINQRMLTKQLRELEEAGIVSRTVFPVVPPRVDYALTAVGCSLKPVTMALAAWGARNVVCDNGRNVIRLADETETASPGMDAA